MRCWSLFALLCATVLIGSALTGCRSERRPVEASASALPAPAPAAPPPPPADPAKIGANEMGMIPVVMYHSVGDPPARRGGPRYDRRGLNISPATFRKHLQMMHAAGWYPVNMRDALTARMQVPAGKTPVVLTFDDGRGSQFRYLPDGSIDPDCVVGILEEFNRRHLDWPLRGTFYLNSNRSNPVPFWQRGKEAQKIQYMLEKGFEIGNHSSTHSSMANMSAARLQWEVADCIRYIRRLAPNATMDTFCLPYGAWPRNRALLGVLMEGSEGGTSYRNLAVLNAWGGPTYPPAHRKFDPPRRFADRGRPGLSGDVDQESEGGKAAAPLHQRRRPKRRLRAPLSGEMGCGESSGRGASGDLRGRRAKTEDWKEREGAERASETASFKRAVI